MYSLSSRFTAPAALFSLATLLFLLTGCNQEDPLPFRNDLLRVDLTQFERSDLQENNLFYLAYDSEDDELLGYTEVRLGETGEIKRPFGYFKRNFTLLICGVDPDGRVQVYEYQNFTPRLIQEQWESSPVNRSLYSANLSNLTAEEFNEYDYTLSRAGSQASAFRMEEENQIAFSFFTIPEGTAQDTWFLQRVSQTQMEYQWVEPALSSEAIALPNSSWQPAPQRPVSLPEGIVDSYDNVSVNRLRGRESQDSPLGFPLRPPNTEDLEDFQLPDLSNPFEAFDLRLAFQTIVPQYTDTYLYSYSGVGPITTVPDYEVELQIEWENDSTGTFSTHTGDAPDALVATGVSDDVYLIWAVFGPSDTPLRIRQLAFPEELKALYRGFATPFPNFRVFYAWDQTQAQSYDEYLEGKSDYLSLGFSDFPNNARILRRRFAN
ncbi:MAG TPA: hypothetical protein DCR93_26120 [Cytophagales bacterium]|nr:hypothetical protein [Cytophagales bacterium]